MAAATQNTQKSTIAHASPVDSSPSARNMCQKIARDAALTSCKLTLHRLAEAVPLPGSGVTLPLDLRTIAARCTNAYHAPQRFAAVQFAFNNPRCRVLIFRKPQARFPTTTRADP
jgi:hypothetical protein